MSSKDIIAKVENITSLSDSQKARLALQQNTMIELMGFLRGYTSQINEHKDLKNTISDILRQKIDEDGTETPYTVLVKTLEVLSKAETDAASPVLKIIESAIKAEKEKEPETPSEGDNATPLTKESIENAKKLLEWLESLKKTEFPEKK